MLPCRCSGSAADVATFDKENNDPSNDTVTAVVVAVDNDVEKAFASPKEDNRRSGTCNSDLMMIPCNIVQLVSVVTTRKEINNEEGLSPSGVGCGIYPSFDERRHQSRKEEKKKNSCRKLSAPSRV